ncbi:MAG: rhomboid family intramembrane serine protease [Ignavibacteria bacterium]
MDAPVTYTLLFANIAIYVWIKYMRPEFFEKFAEWPYEIVNHHKYYQVVTSAFLHADLMHIAFNMFTLFSFGTVLEGMFVMNFGQVLGSLYFFLIYFISLLSGSLLTLVFNYKNPNYVAVGASGAISGIIFSYVLFFPFSKLLVFFIPMPAFLFAFVYVGVSIYGVKNKFGNIGHEAHLGGAFGGVLATFILIEGAFKFFLTHFS